MLLLFGYPKLRNPSKGIHTLMFQENYQWTLISLLVAHRTILKHWISPTPPTLSEIKKELKLLLFREKLDNILQNDGCDQRLESRWRSFIDKHLMATEESSLQTLFRFTSSVFLTPTVTYGNPFQILGRYFHLQGL